MVEDWSITTDIDKAIQGLKSTSLSIPQIQKKVLRIYGKSLAKRYTSAIKENVNSRTGGLYRGFTVYVYKDGSKAVISLKDRKDNRGKDNYQKLGALNYGAVIRPKTIRSRDGNVLHFQDINGNWKSANEVILHGRNFLGSAYKQWELENAFNSVTSNEVDEMIEKEFSKFWD